MTIKEVAKVLNVTDQTIRNYCNKLFPDKIKNGITTDLNELEITEIKIEMNKNYSLKNDFEVTTNLEKKLIIQKGWLYLNEEIKELQLQIAQKDHQIKRLIHAKKLYTTTEIAKELNMKSAQELNQVLFDKDVQYKVNDTWVLKAEYSNKGYESIKQMELDNGLIIYDRKWTGIGRDFLLNLLKDNIKQIKD